MTITIASIQSRVAAHYGLTDADMRSQCRERRVARPRQVAMYLAVRVAGKSRAMTGRRFGGRHHTTVMSALVQIDRRLDAAIFALGVEIGGGMTGWPAGGAVEA